MFQYKSAALLCHEILVRCSFADLHIAISHRSYLSHDGGIEYCIRRDSFKAKIVSVDFVHICPYIPPQSEGKLPSLIQIYLNDELLGVTSIDGFSANLHLLLPSVVFLHSAIVFAPDALIRLLLSAKRFALIVHWIHDLSYACGSDFSVKYGNSFKPILISDTFSDDDFSNGRLIRSKFHDYIESLSSCLVFPSVSALNRYTQSVENIGQIIKIKKFVHPHFIVDCVPSESNLKLHTTSPVGVAYFGHCVQHKGWSKYLELVSGLYGLKDLKFFHVGVGNSFDDRIVDIDYNESISELDRIDLSDICRLNNIKFAFNWPVALESFGIMHRQMLLSGCVILCCNNNPALKEFINDCGRVLYFDAVDDVVQKLKDEDFINSHLVLIENSTCIISSLSSTYDIIDNINDSWTLLLK